MIVPTPPPEVLTCTVYVAGWKLALTYLGPFIASVQSPRPVHPPPLHPLNTALSPGAACSVTESPLATTALQPAEDPVVHAIVPVPTGPVLPPVTVPIAPPPVDTDSV